MTSTCDGYIYNDPRNPDLGGHPCTEAATKVLYRQGQRIERCDAHAGGIQTTWWPIETGDPLYERNSR